MNGKYKEREEMALRLTVDLGFSASVLLMFWTRRSQVWGPVVCSVFNSISDTLNACQSIPRSVVTTQNVPTHCQRFLVENHCCR